MATRRRRRPSRSPYRPAYRPQSRPKRRQYEFKPDPKGNNFFKKLYLTKVQRLKLMKWGFYGLLCLFLLVIQDSMLSAFRFCGATTDLAAAVIILIAIHEGLEKGGMFALIASTIYWCAGSAPGPYTIAFITILTIGANYFRQSIWRRNFGSTGLCTAVTIFVYELAVFGVGIFQGLTIWARLGVFILTAVLSILVMLPVYPAVRAIGNIGGDSWTE